MAGSLGRLFAELRRRRVWRVLIVYAIAGWLVIQVAATVLPSLHLPEWAVTLVSCSSCWGCRSRSRWRGCSMPGRAGWNARRRCRPSPRLSCHRRHRTAVTARRRPHAEPPSADAAATPRIHRTHVARRRRPAHDRRAALREHERRCGERILQRRHRRGNPQPAHATAAAEGRFAHIRRSPTRARTSRIPDVARDLGVTHAARRQRAQGRRPRAHHRAADRHRQRLAPVVGNLRPRNEGRVHHPGRHRAQHRQGAAGDADAAGASRDPVRRDLRPRSLRLLPSRPQLHVFDGASRLRARDPHVRTGDRVDSKYALAYAGMADAYSHLYRYAEATPENADARQSRERAGRRAGSANRPKRTPRAASRC